MDPKKQSATDDFLGELGNDNTIDPLANQENFEDIFPEETKENVEQPKNIPFAKDEKIQRYIDRQVEKRTKDFRPSAQETFTKEVQDAGDDKIINALTRLVGNDTEEKRAVLNDLKSAFGDLKGQAKREAIQEFISNQQNAEEGERQELAEAFDEIEEGFEDIESHYGIELTDRQKSAYKQFLLKVEPKGGYEEYPDFVETFDVFKNYVKSQRPSNSQAKALASRGMERSSSNSESNPVIKRDGTKSLWQTLDKQMDK